MTENGLRLAVMKAINNGAVRQLYWEERERKLAQLPNSTNDSTAFISADRDRG